ncbi:MAG: hypothetical protein KAR21_04850 [Spirochaetales bacterium]|nr:hypothetical protein [Spirochaetales bacterium]
MKSNPVFLEGLILLTGKKRGQLLILLYISLFTFAVLISLPDMAENILSPEFNPPDLFNFIVNSGQISSSVLLVLCYSILFFKAEETLNWIRHGRLNIIQVFAGRFLLILFLTIIVEVISIPWFVFASRISATPDFTVIGVLLINGFAVFTYGQVWILGGFIINKNRVAQTVLLWIYIFIYLLISAKILPVINPVLILHSLIMNLPGKPGVHTVLSFLYPLLYLNLFLLLLNLTAVFVLYKRKGKPDEK